MPENTNMSIYLKSYHMNHIQYIFGLIVWKYLIAVTAFLVVMKNKNKLEFNHFSIKA